MKITREQVDDLNAVVKVEVKKDDYLPQVEEAVKKYRKNVSMKGFRKGMVPASMVKKMYGNSILVDELNKIVSGRLTEHIQEEKLDILGQPLPKTDSNVRLDIRNPEDVTLEYELGLVPQFDLSVISKDTTFEKYTVKIDDELIDNEIENLRLRFGTQKDVEDGAVEEGDILHMTYTELEDGDVKEGGVTSESPVGLNIFKEDAREQFMGMKPGESRDVDLFEISDREPGSVRKFVLNLPEGEAPEGMGTEFRATLNKIGRMEKSELNAEFFKKVFGEGAVEDEAAFREKLRGELETYFGREAETRLKNGITQYLLDHVEMSFPDEFLKRWIRFNNEEPITPEQVEADYGNFVKGLKWNLITNKISEENDIKAEREEIEELSKDQLRKQLEMYNPGGGPVSDSDLDSLNASMMAREDHVKKTYEALMEQKLFDFLLQAVTVDEKPVTLEEFRNVNQAQHG